VSKGSLLVDVGSQLSEALEAAAASEARAVRMEEAAAGGHEVAELLQDTERERDSLARAYEQLQAEVAEREAAAEARGAAARAQQARAGEEEGQRSAAVAEAVAAENAALRAENAAMASELSALSPQFFEEIEDLKYAYAVARQHLDRYEQLYGPPPPQEPP
jgi:hypothetical protein